MKDRNGNKFGYGAGETQARTVVSVLRPASDVVDNFPLIGGAVVRFGTTPTGGEHDFEALFRLQDLPGHPNAWALFADDWPNSFKAAYYGPDPVGGPSGYGGVPLVVEYTSNGPDDIQVFVNNVEIALSRDPLEPHVGMHPAEEFFTYGTINQTGDVYSRWRGGRFEDLIYDVKLTDTPAARTQLYQYLAGRYTSIAW